MSDNLYFPGAVLNSVQPWAPVPGAVPRPAAAAPPVTGAGSFDQALKEAAGQQEELQFSGHAKTRLRSRGLELTPDRMSRLLDGVAQAAAKGARSSLVLLDNLALVVSVNNRTVITALQQTPPPVAEVRTAVAPPPVIIEEHYFAPPPPWYYHRPPPYHRHPRRSGIGWGVSFSN